MIECIYALPQRHGLHATMIEINWTLCHWKKEITYKENQSRYSCIYLNKQLLSGIKLRVNIEPWS